MRSIPHAAGLYLAVLQLVFALGWTVYAIYLPQLAAAVGLSAGTVIIILMADQAIFTVTDFAMGVAADKVSRLVGRLGHWVAAITLISCAAFVGLPFVAGGGLGVAAFFVLLVVWAVTSSALRAPPLMLLGKYAARPAIPYLASLAMLGLGIAGAVSPYLAMNLTKQDPRLPFVIASVALVLTSLALAKVERTLVKQAPPKSEPPQTIDRAVPAPVIVFSLAMVIFALGFQLHFFFNSAPLFKHFSTDISKLMPVFWVGFSVGMFPASRITKRFGGMPVMGAAGLVGALAIVAMQIASTLGLAVAAQLIAGAAWGAILMSAFAVAAALGYTGAEGKVTGVLFSTLALATFARMATTASGALSDPSLAPVLHWAPIVCWVVAGVMLLGLTVTHMRRTTDLAQA
ncbi:MAG TPA: MFS transporter [Xanthobacteraceae bacterium]|nr:MFS transporter [Xanthobacteraceae bacterium]